MKKVKNLLLVALFGVFSFAFVGIANAEDIAKESLFVLNGSSKRMMDMVCEPASLTENGATARCYLVGALKKDSAEGLKEVDGFSVQVFTTKHLRLDAAYVNDGIGNGKAGTAMFDHSPNSIANEKIPGDAPTSMKNFKCIMGELSNNSLGINVEKPLDFKCTLFYTKNTQTSKAFNLNTMKLGHQVTTGISASQASSGVGLIGSFEVHLEAPEGTHECGEICYMLWEIPEKEDYDNTSCSSNPDDDKCKPADPKYECKEIEVNIPKPTVTPEKPEDPTPAPDTGAFTSYAVLAAGALIAVGAIAMAKKNTKFNRL